MLTKVWRWIRGPKPTAEQIEEAELARRELEERREEAVDEFYEDGFPSREAQKGYFWIP